MDSEGLRALRRDSRRTSTQAALFACIAVAAFGNFLFTPFAANLGAGGAEFLLAAYAGAIGAEVALHAIWCVLAPLKLARRLGTGIGIGSLLLGTWAWGFASLEIKNEGFQSPSFRFLLAVLFALPLIAIAVQLPLWVARCFFHWRVFHRCDPARRAPPQSLGIRDILLATGAVAVGLSGAQLVGMVTNSSPGQASIRLVISAMVIAAVSLVTTLPILVATLRARWLGTSLPMVLVLYFLAVVLLSALSPGGRRGLGGEMMLFFLALAAGFFVALTGGLVIARRLGYRLYWGRRRRGEGGGRKAEVRS